MRGSILAKAMVAALVGLLASACSGDEGGGNATPAATQAGTREPQLTATFTIPVTNTPQPTDAVRKAFWLLDAESGGVVTLLEDHEEEDYWGGFDSAGERVYVWSSRPGGEEAGFDLAGNEVSRGPAPEVRPLCQPNQTVIVQGQSVPRCEDRTGWAPFPSPGAPRQYYIFDTPSPDGRWDVYEPATGLPTQTPASGDSYDLWAVNLQTGERGRIFQSLYRCGGCDGDVETGWSPSGRYYVHVERGPDGRVLLVDFTARSVSDITWRTEFGFTGTAWSPVADVLLRTAGPDALAITDLTAGTEHIVPGATWGSGFDASGRHVYAWGTPEDALVVVEVASGDVLRRFAGERENSDGAPMAVTPLGIVAVMGYHRGEACEGTSVRLDAREVACVEGGDWAAIAPDGSKVAVARRTGAAQQTTPAPYDVVLVDLASGSQTVVADGAVSGYPPKLTWNAASTHLLIEWPVYRGL